MKKNSKTPKAKTTDLERETRVLLEEIRHEVKTVAEGHGVIVSKLDDIDNMLRKNESDHFKIEMDVESIKSKTGTIDIKLDRIERELETVKNAVMDTSNVTKDHEKRIKKVEEKVFV